MSAGKRRALEAERNKALVADARAQAQASISQRLSVPAGVKEGAGREGAPLPRTQGGGKRRAEALLSRAGLLTKTGSEPSKRKEGVGGGVGGRGGGVGGAAGGGGCDQGGESRLKGPPAQVVHKVAERERSHTHTHTHLEGFPTRMVHKG